MATLTTEQLDDLQGFLKDWLRHSGRTFSRTDDYKCGGHCC
mgnify:CR=1 FL=1